MFAQALTHGTLPWRAETHERRVVYTLFQPFYVGGGGDNSPQPTAAAAAHDLLATVAWTL